MLDEALDNKRRSQLSTVMRYVVKGDSSIAERFVGFTDVSADRTLDSSKQTFAMQEYLKKRTPSFAPTRWCFTSRLVNMVEQYHEQIIDFFISIYESSDNIWDGHDRCVANGYSLFFEEVRDCLFIKSVITFVFLNRFIISNTAGRQYQYIVLLKCYQRFFKKSLKMQETAMKVTILDFS